MKNLAAQYKEIEDDYYRLAWIMITKWDSLAPGERLAGLDALKQVRIRFSILKELVQKDSNLQLPD